MNLGFGVMLSVMLSNDNTVENVQVALGKKIQFAKIIDGNNYNYLLIKFDDFALKLWDDGQSCCESRWMYTDDDLDYYAGSFLQNVEVREGPSIKNEEGWGGVKESEFLLITTDKGVFTIVNYNSHNGHYGGFYIKSEIVNYNSHNEFYIKSEIINEI